MIRSWRSEQNIGGVAEIARPSKSNIYLHYQNEINFQQLHMHHISADQHALRLRDCPPNMSMIEGGFTMATTTTGKKTVSSRTYVNASSKLGMLFSTSISLALLHRETCSILRNKSLYATRKLEKKICCSMSTNSYAIKRPPETRSKLYQYILLQPCNVKCIPDIYLSKTSLYTIQELELYDALLSFNNIIVYTSYEMHSYYNSITTIVTIILLN